MQDTDRLHVYGASEKWLREHGLYDRIANGERPVIDRHGTKLKIVRLELMLSMDSDGSALYQVLCEKLEEE